MIAPSLEMIEQYLQALFGYTEGWIALRSFPEAGKQGKPSLRWIGNDEKAASIVHQFACEAHQAGRACYLIPGTVSENGKAGSADVMQMGAVLVDIDTGDTKAKLEHLSQHLGKMREDGLVATRREAQTVFYRIADPNAARVLALLKNIYCP